MNSINENFLAVWYMVEYEMWRWSRAPVGGQLYDRLDGPLTDHFA